MPLLGKNALKWPKKLKLIPKNYHSKAFEGNACRKLLKISEKLNDPEVLGDRSYHEVVPILSTLKAMNKVVESSFSTRRIGNDIDQHFEELNNSFFAHKQIKCYRPG